MPVSRLVVFLPLDWAFLEGAIREEEKEEGEREEVEAFCSDEPLALSCLS